MPTILFLHGRFSVPGGVKPTYLKDHGHEVINPKLPDDDMNEAVRIAQAEFDKHQPQVVVGSSRGGAVAMNINSGDAKLVLLCPAWKKYGTAKMVKPGTVILHSKNDDVIPFADSEELARSSGAKLIEVGNDHRLADPEPLEAMLRECGESVERPTTVSSSFPEFIAELNSYMRNRVCGIVFAESKERGQPNFEFGSGFVIEAGGLLVLVTAGHVFEKIAKWHDGNRLIGVSLILPSGPKNVTELSLFPDDLAIARYCVTDNCDIGFMCIAPDIIPHFQTAGLVMIRRENPEHSNRKVSKRVLIGYGADGAYVHNQPFLYTVEKNVVRSRIRSHLGAVPFKIVGLQNSTTENGVNYQAIPEVDETPTLIGMSGGVVIDVFSKEPIRNYEWVGVQCAQHSIEKHGKEIVTKVEFLSSAAVTEMADEYASEIRAAFETGEAKP